MFELKTFIIYFSKKMFDELELFSRTKIRNPLSRLLEIRDLIVKNLQVSVAAEPK